MWVRFHKCYAVLIRRGLSRLKTGSSFSFSILPRSAAASATSGRPEAARRRSTAQTQDVIFLQIGDKAVHVTEPQACVDLSKWTMLLGSSMVCDPQIQNVSFIIETADNQECCQSSCTSNMNVLKWSDYCLPLACYPGQPFRAVAQASLDNFIRLGVAFIEDRLHLDNGLVPSKIVPVLLQQSTLSELLEKQHSQSPKTKAPLSLCGTQTDTDNSVAESFPCCSAAQSLPCNKDCVLETKTNLILEELQDSEHLCDTQDLSPVCDSEDHSMEDHHHMRATGHHLHLSSCHECLELENSTIDSVKYASSENISELPADRLDKWDSGDGTFDPVMQDDGGAYISDMNSRYNPKPPNVLVYTSGSMDRYGEVSQLLSECINMENNIVYHLLPQQALSDPWLDNTRLLVLAEEQSLTSQLQARFLKYLRQGGRILGLSSTFCPPGLCLKLGERRQGEVSRVSFSKESSTELDLDLLASGNIYTTDTQEEAEVELWGELKLDIPSQKDMVIARVTGKENAGEAVLCQVHLEVAPESQTLTSVDFDKLKVSNALRYQVLIAILTSLGLSCEQNPSPALSPVHLLATSQEAKAGVLKWLETHSAQNGVFTLSKACQVANDDTCLPGGPLALVTDSCVLPTSAQFCMETYTQNLSTSLLGHTLLYAEVVTSTMDLLEGMSFKLPKDVGLIAVASQQIQGRGRGRNAWLSPLGCAMFTLAVQVELNSALGRRIPFLQHLVALAVVEAVRTLPGYQDIDLRVKWPNDIYYSNLIKIGGVLVTSTFIGSTFHLLIGCGFNVTNSNPTMCINDLILQHNKQNNSNLQPLSCAQLIAQTVTQLETLISTFQQGGPDAVLPTYYKRWLHSGSQVRLGSEDGSQVDVVGLDHNGFLQVYSEEQGLVSLEPDGNSFDMLKNLIVIKHQ